MDPLTIGLITGGASLLGNIFSSDTSAQNTQANIGAQEMMQGQTQAFNAQQADLNRQFQASQVTGQQQFENQMSSTAYQRASADMQKAGLNPAMMFGSGSAASTPGVSAAGGSTASVGTPNMALSNRTSPFASVGDAVSKAISSASAMQSMAKTDADISVARAQKHNIDADTTRTDVLTANEGQRGGAIPAQVRQAESDAATAAANSAVARNRAITAENEAAINPTVRKVGDVASWGAGKASDVIMPFLSTASKVGSFLPQNSRSTTEYNRDEYGNLTGSDTFNQRYQSFRRPTF